MAAAAPPPPVRFERFVLDEANALLTVDGRPLKLEPKAFAVLCELVRRPGQLASKDALLDAVWGHRHVSESVLKSVISQLRTLLGDDAGQPRFIETVSRRGYRFIGAAGAANGAGGRDGGQAMGGRTGATGASGGTGGTGDAHDTATDQANRDLHAASPSAPLPAMVGRADALARLHALWQRARSGQRQLVWIEGDAGIGKTTLIDRFVAEVGVAHHARGQCVEQYGTGEPYLPLLEALDALTRRAPEHVALVRQAAPTWLVQMPWLVAGLAEGERAALQAELTGAGQERMARELWELMSRLTRDTPLVLVTEDLHWSDHGTLRLMDHFARQRGPMRLLWLASFRLAQVLAEQHPLQPLRQELRLHRLCEELLLDSFSETEVAAYVEGRVGPGTPVAPEFARSLHAHTDGLPLFVANVLDGLLAEDVSLPGRADGWAGAGEVAPRALSVPESLAGVIERQLTRLPTGTAGMLEAASVCGMEFRAATAATLLGQAAHDVVEACDSLVRRQTWLREAGVTALPDGTLDARYAFRHAIYKHVFYQRLSGAQRAAYHRQAARALDEGRARGAAATSAEIASHHELGLEPGAAMRHYSAAAESALALFAPQEALQLTDRALGLLPSMPEGEERLERELSLQASRGNAFTLLHGIAAAASVEAFARVRALSARLPPTPARTLMLNSMGWNDFARCDYEGALALSDRIETGARAFDDPVLFIFACNLRGTTLATMGRFKDACASLRSGLEVCEREGEELAMDRLLIDPEVSLWANIAVPMCQLGLVDAARAMAEKAVARASRRGQPMARMVAHWVACMLAIRLDDVQAADRHAGALEELVATAIIQHAAGPARWNRGWVECRLGRPAEGLAAVMEGYRLYEQAGTLAGCTEALSYAAEAQIQLGRWADAQATLEQAFGNAQRFGERQVMTELLLLQARVDAGRGDAGAARRAIEAALAEARQAGALHAQLRVALAWAEGAAGSPPDEGLVVLREALGSLTEGSETPLVRRARSLVG